LKDLLQTMDELRYCQLVILFSQVWVQVQLSIRK